MDENKLRIMAMVIGYLRDEFQAGYLDPENAEGLEVAIHCLENIYDVKKLKKPEEVPKLTDVYRAFSVGAAVHKTPTEAEKVEAERLKVEGNCSMSSGKYEEAIEYYSRAIELNPNNAVYYCNRAAAFSKKDDHENAIRDCKVAIALDPNYSKAYGRLGLAYCGLEQYENALENYQKAHDLEPDNEGYKRNLDLAKQKVAHICQCQQERSQNQSQQQQQQQRGGTGNFYRIPDDIRDEIFANARNNPVSPMELLANPEFVNIASQLLSDPTMQTMMNSILNQDGTNGMQALLQAGQTLARSMQNENPAFFDQLRQQFAATGNPPPDNQSNGNPEQGGNKQQ